MIQYPKIIDFIHSKQFCFFCQSHLSAKLTNFTSSQLNGLQRRTLPILNIPINHNLFFQINHTTENYGIKSDVSIDINSNHVVFTPLECNPKLTPHLDKYVAKDAFDDLKPYIELYCPNQCKFQYHLSSYVIDMQAQTDIVNHRWTIASIKLFLESFQYNNLIIQNDYFTNKTNIYSTHNDDLAPITIPLLDFQKLGQEDLLTRISTYITYS